MNSTLREELEKILSDDFACTRVWEAWQFGTMTQDDFVPLNETERVDELLALIQRKQLEAKREALKPIKEWVDNYDNSRTFAGLSMLVYDAEQRLLAELTKELKEK